MTPIARTPEQEAPTPAIDTGDVVVHGPTGEKWVVAYVDGDRLAWVGWPEGEAMLSDCTLVTKAPAGKRASMLKELAAMKGDDRRGRYARARLSARSSSGETPHG
jgi:hypothetical protein